MNRLPVLSALAHSAPRVAFRELRSVWFQITGTRCNLACRHCFNASGPRDPWLLPLAVAVVHRHLAEAEALGVREVYLTGGEPLLHPDLFAIVESALRVAATTILTNGTLLTDGVADRLATLAAASAYSLEVRVAWTAPRLRNTTSCAEAGPSRRRLTPSAASSDAASTRS